MDENLIERLLAGDVQTVAIHPDGRAVAGDPVRAALLSGSFNPLHEGHLRLAAAAAAATGMPAVFELPVVNADKGTLALGEVKRRLHQFRGRHTVVLSQAPLFSQKAALFPGCVFVLGYDTALRLVAPRYYGGEEGMRAALAAVRAAGCRFLVAGRLHAGHFQTLADLALPPEFADLFTALPEELFRVDISSTELRRRQASST